MRRSKSLLNKIFLLFGFRKKKAYTGKDFKVTVNGIPIESFEGEIQYIYEPIETLGKLEVCEVISTPKIKDHKQ